MKSSFLLTGILALTCCASGIAQTPDPQKTADEIRVEAIRKNSDPAGKALPLLSSWNNGKYLYAFPYHNVRGLDPAFQLQEIEKGRHIMPNFAFPDASDDKAQIEKYRAYYELPLQRAAELKLPLTLASPQWESLLTTDKKYFDLPMQENPNVVTAEGEVKKMLTPFGPIEPWREVGRRWASSPLMKQLQEWYPNPPAITFLSNNEQAKLRWKEVETDPRYLALYGPGRDDNFKRKVIGDAWVERYKALQEGMREALSPGWREHLNFVGYEAFGGSYFARWGGWLVYSQYTPGRFEPYPLMWDGNTSSFYVDQGGQKADYLVWSPQIESMNWVFMQKKALEMNPEFQFNFSVWDGQEFNNGADAKSRPESYRKLGQEFTPLRYSGSAQFGLWLLRPRVMHEYRAWMGDLVSMKPYYLALADVVDHIYNNETLKQFWRHGELVPNRAHKHPFQSMVPEEFENEDRWFLLDTNLDPPRPWKLQTELPVFSLALTQGEPGARRWLVYAHSPVQNRSQVEITIPEYRKITVDVPVAGAFYVVDEKANSVTAVK